MSPSSSATLITLKLGQGKALEMSLTGEAISADDACQHGLVARVVPGHELLDIALRWAWKLASQPPQALEQIKRVSAGTLDQGIEAEKQGFTAVFGSRDAREGIAAFVEKRTPRFTGQ